MLGMDDHRLIAQIYQSVWHPDASVEMVADLAEIIRARCVHLYAADLRDGSEIVSGVSGVDPDLHERYKSDYAARDRRMPYFIESQVGTVINNAQLLENIYDRGAKEDPFYNEVLVPYDMENLLFASFTDPGKRYVGGLVPSRGRNQEDFSPEDVDRLKIFAFHLLSATDCWLKNHEQLAENNLVSETLKASPQPYFVVSKDRNILDMNPSAEEMLEGDGQLQCHNGCLSLSDNLAQNRLLALLERCGDTYAGAPSVKGGSVLLAGGDGELILDVSPWTGPRPDCSIWSRALAIIRVQPLKLDEDRVTAGLRELFGVSRTEAETVKELAAGNAPRKIAEGRQVSYETVRNQLKSAMHKMDCRRQSDLVRLVLRLFP